MFIPAFCDLSPCVSKRYIWHFYGALNMQKGVHGPIIAPEDYFGPPSEFLVPESVPAWEQRGFFNCNLPEDGDLDKITHCPIPAALLEQIITKYGSKSDAAVALFNQRIPELEAWFRATLAQLRQQSDEPLEGLLLVADIPSFSGPCREENIPVLYYELAAFRLPTYFNATYYSRSGVHLHLKLEEVFNQFREQAADLEPWEQFTPQEILALSLVPEKLSLLQQYGSTSGDKIGLLAESTYFQGIQGTNHKCTLDVLDVALSHFSSEKLILRNHPTDPARATYEGFGIQIDHSPSLLDFLLNCSMIISRTSNSILEALLWNKPVYAMDPDPYGFVCLSSLDNTNNFTIDPLFLNFMAFGFYFPSEFTFDIDYLRWRCSNPSWVEIYRRNLRYRLSVEEIPEEILHQPGPERLERILQARGVDVTGFPIRNVAEQTTGWQEELNRLKKQLSQPGKMEEVLQIHRLMERLHYASFADGRISVLPRLTSPHQQSCRDHTTFRTTSTLFYDTGTGFQTNQSLSANLDCRAGTFCVAFPLPPEVQEKAIRFRWDPLEGYACKVQVDVLDGMSLEPINSFSDEGNTSVFCTIDPMYRLDVSKPRSAITLHGTLHLIDQDEAAGMVASVSERARVLQTQAVKQEKGLHHPHSNEKAHSFIRNLFNKLIHRMCSEKAE